MPGPEVRIGINETQYLGKIKVTAEVEKKEKVIPSSVARHEAKHAVAAEFNGTRVISATIIPGPGYLGLTRLSRPDAIAAAAPHATGSSGTSHDMRIVGLMGHDAAAVSSAARAIIDKNHEQVEAVATILEEKGTVTGSEIQYAIRDAEKKEDRVKIIVENLEDGDRTTETATATKGIVVFRSEWVKRHTRREDFSEAA